MDSTICMGEVGVGGGGKDRTGRALAHEENLTNGTLLVELLTTTVTNPTSGVHMSTAVF
jgi:hypothetical protein